MYRRQVLAAAGLAVLPGVVRAAAGGGTINVLYAGSLVNLMEHGLGAAFQAATGVAFSGFAGGSGKLANEIKGRLRPADVFISASPKVNDDLAGAANGDWVSWYIAFAQSPLVIGYNPASRFAAALRSTPWYQALQSAGIRIGRTDAKLDPKGKLTLDLLAKAAIAYRIPDLTTRVLGAPDNPDQVLPEETLVGRLQSGQLDAGFFYSTETTDLKIPTIPLPQEVALAAHYTATVLNRAANPSGGASLVGYLLGAPGQALMRAHGLDLVPARLGGDAAAVPPALRRLIAPTG